MTTSSKILNLSALLAASALAFSAPAIAASNDDALLDMLTRKGILTDGEAKSLKTELSAEQHAAITKTIAAGKSTTELKLKGRVQVQYAGIDSHGGNGAPSTNHFYLRRIYFGGSAKLGDNWGATISYDFAANDFDVAYASWGDEVLGTRLDVDVGIRKVNMGYEEQFTSSGALKSIERSAATRYFIEDNNGRRLGAGGNFVGVYADVNRPASAGKVIGAFGGLSVTNPEKAVGGASIGNAGNNGVPAVWANAGYNVMFDKNNLIFGGAFGYQPDQGGSGSSANDYGRGAGNDTFTGSAYIYYTHKKFTLGGEAFVADVENGKIGGASDSIPWGLWVQGSYMITDELEAVARYSYVNTNGRGISTSDGIKSAPGSFVADGMHEYFIGMNYYFKGNDVKFQLGYVGGRTFGSFGGRDETTISGVRSQVQVQF